MFYLLFYFNIFMDEDKSQSLSFIVGSSKITLTPTIKSKGGHLVAMIKIVVVYRWPKRYAAVATICRVETILGKAIREKT